MKKIKKKKFKMEIESGLQMPKTKKVEVKEPKKIYFK